MFTVLWRETLRHGQLCKYAAAPARDEGLRTKDTMGRPQIIAGHLANECVTKHRAQGTLLEWKPGGYSQETQDTGHSRTRTGTMTGAAGVAARSKVSRANVVLIANCDWNAVETRKRHKGAAQAALWPN